MNNFNELNLLLKHQKNELNELYKNPKSKILKQAFKISGLKNSKSVQMALLKRIIDLKEDGLDNEMQKANFSEQKKKKIKAKMYDFVSSFYIKRFENCLQNAKILGILDEFNSELLASVHKIGIILTKMQKSWQKLLIDKNSAYFEKNFPTLAKANEFISKHKFFQTNANGSRADRIYGAPNLNKLKMQTYANAFKKDSKKLKTTFDEILLNLNKTAKNSSDEAYIKYFKALKNAFLEKNNAKVISKWQEAECAWMDCKGDLQIGHPLEYYEDAYTHAVALEWDIRLKDSSYKVDENALKTQIKSTFEYFFNKVSTNENMKNLVFSNIDKTQLYISNPFIYYGADFNGLFSAQVVPNDEIVSKKFGKKIFAFVDFIHKASKARPFSKLANEIFSKEFLDFNREILFCKPKIWKKVYEITTIGHEFGHILFIDEDTENLMNKNGEFKFIEEFKATSGGLVNFFLNEDKEYSKAVFSSVIARAVSLISWQKVNEVKAYYCEGLIELSLLFKAEVLEFNQGSLNIKLENYEKFKEIFIQNYENLAKHYSDKKDASEFLANFAVQEDGVYLPKDEVAKEFVKFYYGKYEIMANEIDESNEWQLWQEKSVEN